VIDDEGGRIKICLNVNL